MKNIGPKKLLSVLVLGTLTLFSKFPVFAQDQAGGLVSTKKIGQVTVQGKQLECYCYRYNVSSEIDPGSSYFCISPDLVNCPADRGVCRMTYSGAGCNPWDRLLPGKMGHQQVSPIPFENGRVLIIDPALKPRSNLKERAKDSILALLDGLLPPLYAYEEDEGPTTSPGVRRGGVVRPTPNRPPPLGTDRLDKGAAETLIADLESVRDSLGDRSLSESARARMNDSINQAINKLRGVQRGEDPIAVGRGTYRERLGQDPLRDSNGNVLVDESGNPRMRTVYDNTEAGSDTLERFHDPFVTEKVIELPPRNVGAIGRGLDGDQRDLSRIHIKMREGYEEALSAEEKAQLVTSAYDQSRHHAVDDVLRGVQRQQRLSSRFEIANTDSTVSDLASMRSGFLERIKRSEGAEMAHEIQFDADLALAHPYPSELISKIERTKQILDLDAVEMIETLPLSGDPNNYLLFYGREQDGVFSVKSDFFGARDELGQLKNQIANAINSGDVNALNRALLDYDTHIRGPVNHMTPGIRSVFNGIVQKVMENRQLVVAVSRGAVIAANAPAIIKEMVVPGVRLALPAAAAGGKSIIAGFAASLPVIAVVGAGGAGVLIGTAIDRKWGAFKPRSFIPNSELPPVDESLGCGLSFKDGTYVFECCSRTACGEPKKVPCPDDPDRFCWEMPGTDLKIPDLGQTSGDGGTTGGSTGGVRPQPCIGNCPGEPSTNEGPEHPSEPSQQGNWDPWDPNAETPPSPGNTVDPNAGGMATGGGTGPGSGVDSGPGIGTDTGSGTESGSESIKCPTDQCLVKVSTVDNAGAPGPNRFECMTDDDVRNASGGSLSGCADVPDLCPDGSTKPPGGSCPCPTGNVSTGIRVPVSPSGQILSYKILPGTAQKKSSSVILLKSQVKESGAYRMIALTSDCDSPGPGGGAPSGGGGSEGGEGGEGSGNECDCSSLSGGTWITASTLDNPNASFEVVVSNNSPICAVINGRQVCATQATGDRCAVVERGTCTDTSDISTCNGQVWFGTCR